MPIDYELVDIVEKEFCNEPINWRLDYPAPNALMYFSSLFKQLNDT